MKRLIQLTAAAVLLFGSAPIAFSQSTASTSNIVDIAYKGIPVVVDGDLADWNDAHFIFMSQDSPFFLQVTNNGPVQGVPTSPADFSAYFSLKMDDDAIYIAARVRDEGVPLYGAPATPNLAFDFDHISLYLGLYDIADLESNPHVEGTNPNAPSNFMHIHPTTGEEFTANRHYRIGPGKDNTTTTRGPDYQLLIRNVEHDPASFESRDFTYAGAYVDTTLGGTTAAVVLWENERGYDVEWRIPFASLAGKIAKGSGPFSDFEWPLFVPSHNMVIPFDVDVTDRDAAEGLNNYLRAGRYPSLWRDSHNFGMRGRIVDLSLHPNDSPNSKFYVDYKAIQNVTIDGDMSDWADAMFYGNSQDHPHFLQVTNNGPVQGVAESPADFSYYYSMKVDDDNLYLGIIVRDEGVPMIGTPATPNLAFDYDHLSVYLGLFDIGTAAGSPHVEGTSLGASSSFKFIHPTTGEEFAANRHYRIAPGADNTESTLGPDYQLLIRAIEHDPASFESRSHTYAGAYVDTTLGGTVAAGVIWDTELGYFLEWKIPFTSIAGKIAKGSGPYADFEWPQFAPAVGQVFVFDADITDRDVAEGLNNYLRLGRYPSLWRDSHNFGMRGSIITNGVPAVSIDRDLVDGNNGERPSRIQLGQNYPNPFNPTTSINYSIPQSEFVRLSVYNMLGQEVALLVNGVRPSGTSTVSFDATNLSSGMYIYRISTTNETVTRKMMLVK